MGLSVIIVIIALAGGSAYYQFVCLPSRLFPCESLPVFEVEVTARQWTFEGPDGTNVITVPKGSRVMMSITAVMDRLPGFENHGLSIEGYGVSVVLPQGRKTIVEFDADEDGEFVMKCIIFCGFDLETGEGHDTMTGTLKVVVEG